MSTQHPEARTEVVVITGASGGVGRATAHRFARTGARIALIARGAAQLEAAAREVRDLGGTPLTLRVDVADAAAVHEAADLIERVLGPIDIWINNAMATVFARVRNIEPHEFRRATEVTYLGMVWGTQAGANPARNRLLESNPIRRTHRRATHTSGLEAG